MYKVTNKESIAPLFEGWDETLIWSCLQACMGMAYAKEGVMPESAGVLVADFCWQAARTVKRQPISRLNALLILLSWFRRIRSGKVSSKKYTERKRERSSGIR